MKEKLQLYDIAIIGGGAAGCMAAIRARQLGKEVVLIERNTIIGKKILLTGNGRCNLTNTATIDEFLEKFGRSGEFLRSAFFLFSNNDLMEFFQDKGLKLRIESQGKVYPTTDKASSVVLVLEKYLKENSVDIMNDMRVINIERKGDDFILVSQDKICAKSKKVIITTGGKSYKITGSTGDGLNMASCLGHDIISSKPALVPLVTKESWVKDLQGLSLTDVRLIFYFADKKINSSVGEIIFTHFGVSGPLILDMSNDVVLAFEKHKEIRMFIDLEPNLTKDQLENKLRHEFSLKASLQIKNFMQNILPKRMVNIFLSIRKISPEKRVNQITKQERLDILGLLKTFPLVITGSLSIDEAMVTSGGVSRRCINPRTMESKIVPGLYFAGEIIDGRAISGGYNLQQAFSTGYLAGEMAAKSLE